MFFIGIDVAKNKHDLACLSHSGEVIISHCSFENSHTGFLELENQLKLISPITQDVHIALESTGHYSLNIVVFLQNLGYSVFTYNPLIINEFAKSQSLRMTKTDIKDALLIARKLRSDISPARYDSNESLDALKELTRHQHRLIQARSKCKVHFVRMVDMIFPELTSIVSNLHTNFIYELLYR